MSADIFILFGPTKESDEYHAYLTQIDHMRQLFAPYSIEDNKLSYEGGMSFPGYGYSEKSETESKLESLESFKLITGQDAQGPVKAQFKYPTLTLTLSDGQTTFKMDVINLGKNMSMAFLDFSFSTALF